MRKDKYEKHVKNCSGIPGVLYNLDTQNVASFAENLKYKDDLPFVAYCDFETMTSEYLLDLENNEMFPVLYVIIFTCHLDLNLDRIVIEISVGHDLVNYFNHDILSFVDSVTMNHLRNCPIKVSK